MPEEVVVMAGMHSSFYFGQNQSQWFPFGPENMYVSHGFFHNPPPPSSSMAYSQPKMQHQPQHHAANYVSNLLTNFCSAVTNTFTYFTGMVGPSNTSDHIPQTPFPVGTEFGMDMINDILTYSTLNPEAAEFWPGLSGGFQDNRSKRPWGNCQGSRMRESWTKGFHPTSSVKVDSKDWFLPASTCDTHYDLVTQDVSVLEEGLQSVYYESIQDENKRARSQVSYQQQQEVVEHMMQKFTNPKKIAESQVDDSVIIGDSSPSTSMEMRVRNVPEVVAQSDQISKSSNNIAVQDIVEKVVVPPNCSANGPEKSSSCSNQMENEALPNNLMAQKFDKESAESMEELSAHEGFRNEDTSLKAFTHESVSMLKTHPSSEIESLKEDSVDSACKYLKTEAIPSRLNVQNEKVNKDNFEEAVGNTSTPIMTKADFSCKEESKSKPVPLVSGQVKTAPHLIRRPSYADIVKGKETTSIQSISCQPTLKTSPASTFSSHDSVSLTLQELSTFVSETPLPSSSLNEVHLSQSFHLPEAPVSKQSRLCERSSHVTEGAPVSPSSHSPDDTLLSHASDGLKSENSLLPEDLEDTREDPVQPLESVNVLEKTEEDYQDDQDDLVVWSRCELQADQSTEVEVDESSEEESDDEDSDEEWDSSCVDLDVGRRRNFSESSNTSCDSIVFSDSCSGLDLAADEIDGSLIAFLPESNSTTTGCSVKLLEFVCPPDDSDDDDDEDIVFSQNLPSDSTCMWVQKSCELSIKSSNTLPEFNVDEPRSGYEVYVSFSTAADDDIEQMSAEHEHEATLLEVNRKWNQLCCSQPVKMKTCTKVKFQEAVMIVEIPADEDRKGPWALYALDTERFRRRVEASEKVISPVFCQSHRETVYKQRFA